MAVVTTGSTVNGLVPGFREHLGGGIAVLYCTGNPNGVVTGPAQGASADSSISGTCVAYDDGGDQLYQNTTGSTWQKLGSVS